MDELGRALRAWLPGRRRDRHPVHEVLLLSVAAVLTAMLVTGGSLLRITPLAAGPTAAQDRRPPLDEPSAPVRVTIPSLGVDLPVVSSERNVPGNVRGYPLCDVAQYWTSYDLPGAPGTAWIYAHAQPGMFLPMLLEAERTSGEGLIGEDVMVQVRDGRLLRYRITEVKQRAYNRSIAERARPSSQRLVLQTSEGPPGTPTRLQVAAVLVGAEWTIEPAPKPEPRACWQPRSTDGGKKPRPTASPAPTTTDGSSAPDTAGLVMGGGAVLLGALLLAVYLVRRPATGSRR